MDFWKVVAGLKVGERIPDDVAWPAPDLYDPHDAQDHRIHELLRDGPLTPDPLERLTDEEIQRYLEGDLSVLAPGARGR